MTSHINCRECNDSGWVHVPDGLGCIAKDECDCGAFNKPRGNQMKQDDIFDTPAYKLVRNEDPITSHEAAESVDVNRMERKVYEVIKRYGAEGAISDQVLFVLEHYGYSTVTARYKQLKEKGLVKTDHRKRKGKSGRNQLIMWSKNYYREETNEV